MREWVLTWRAAGDALARIKRDELRQLDTCAALEQLADAFDHALRTAPATLTSGLIEQQRILQRLRP
jgi:hypothetical protein